MPFLRFSRDKRGYEHTYLIHANAKKGSGARILYWYRTPPGVKVGRLPFDEAVRRALEAQYPSLGFDWEKLMNTPAPPPDAEHWRERRRAEKAARQARQAAERDDPDGSDEPMDPEESHQEPELVDAASQSLSEGDEGVTRAGAIEPALAGSSPAPIETSTSPPGAGSPEVRPSGRRRRRRGGRRRAGPPPDPSGGPPGEENR